jgi:hypothetical protein
MPPTLAWWAGSLQLSGLAPAQADMARQFLSRAARLDPRMRAQMAHRIAGEVTARIAPPPPPGTPPELVLAAVLAERHRRELDRLHVSRPTSGPSAWTPPVTSSPPPVTPPSGSGFAAPQ